MPRWIFLFAHQKLRDMWHPHVSRNISFLFYFVKYGHNHGFSYSKLNSCAQMCSNDEVQVSVCSHNSMCEVLGKSVLG